MAVREAAPIVRVWDVVPALVVGAVGLRGQRRAEGFASLLQRRPNLVAVAGMPRAGVSLVHVRSEGVLGFEPRLRKRELLAQCGIRCVPGEVLFS